MWQVGIEVRKDITATVLRKKARSEKNGRVAMRLLGIANILDGMDRDTAARTVGMTRQTLRDWVRRYNKEGIEGLYNRPQGHAPRALSAEQEREIDALISQPPKDKSLVRWRCLDIKVMIEQRFGIVLHESSVANLLHRLGFRRLTVRPTHPNTSPSMNLSTTIILAPKAQ